MNWVAYFQSVVGTAVLFEPYQSRSSTFWNGIGHDPPIAVHLIEPNGTVTNGAEATFRMLAYARSGDGWLWWYKHVPGFAYLSEWLYRFVATHRSAASTVTNVIWGTPIRNVGRTLVRWILVRGVGVVYTGVFLSFALATARLVKQPALLPVEMTFAQTWQALGLPDREHVPSEILIQADGVTLWVITTIGCVSALTVVLTHRFHRGALAIMLIAHLAILATGRIALGSPWDALLMVILLLTLIYTVLSRRCYTLEV